MESSVKMMTLGRIDRAFLRSFYSAYYLAPCGESFASELPVIGSRDQAATGIEGVVDRGVS
jgi:hypothetical protein